MRGPRLEIHMMHIDCREEATYRPKVTVMVKSVRASPILAGVSPDFELICFGRPYLSHWSLSGQQHLFRNLDFEGLFRRDEGMVHVMVG